LKHCAVLLSSKLRKKREQNPKKKVRASIVIYRPKSSSFLLQF